MMPLGIVFVGAELGVMIQMPLRELAGRNAARDRVQQPQKPLRDGSLPLEDDAVDDLVQQDREVENREALHEGQRHPDQRVVEMDEPPRRKPQERELPRRHHEVPGGRLPVEVAHLLTRDGVAELSP
jgi:hypothetical protein